jgi:type IV secretion system protein VirB5
MGLAAELIMKRSSFKPTVAPESAFARAKEEWNDRIGGTVKAARNWRLAAFGSMAVTALAVAGLIYESSRSTVQPFYVRVAENGQPFVVGRVPETFTPTLNEIRWHLGQWLAWTRGIPLDPVVVKKNYQQALYFMRQAAANKLNSWAQQDPRLQAIGRETVEFSLIGIAPISGTNSYQARWKETVRNTEGGVKEEQRWMATFNVEIHPPTSADAIVQNPIGLYIKDFQWSREI